MISSFHLGLVLLGLLCFSSLYYLSRAYFARWLVKTVLGYSVQLGAQSSKPPRNEMTESNNTKKATTSNETKAYVRSVSVGDLSEIAQLSVGMVFACVASVFSVVIMWQSKDDIINNQSPVLIPFAHFGAWYYLVDLYTMFESHRQRKQVGDLPLRRVLFGFFLRRWPMVTHHLLLLCVAYPMTVNNEIRGGKGDFVLGALIAEEISTPFLSAAKILRLLGFDRSLFYKLVGLVLIVTFFIVRVANLPLVLVVFAAQHHKWDFPSALTSMTPACHLFNSIQQFLQTYWFFQLLQIAIGSYCRCSSKKHTRQKSD